MGLLLLRVALGITSFIQVAVFLSAQSNPTFRTLFAEIAAIVCGISILLGFITPVISALLFAEGLIVVIFLFSDSVQLFPSPVIYGIILSAALILLGPGAFSADAILFGRREVIIPKN